MIGTLVQGLKDERRGWNHLQLYKLENFTSEWNRLAEDSGLKKLLKFDISTLYESEKNSHAASNISRSLLEFLDLSLSSPVDESRLESHHSFSRNEDEVDSVLFNISDIRSPDGNFHMPVGRNATQNELSHL